LQACSKRKRSRQYLALQTSSTGSTRASITSITNLWGCPPNGRDWCPQRGRPHRATGDAPWWIHQASHLWRFNLLKLSSEAIPPCNLMEQISQAWAESQWRGLIHYETHRHHLDVDTSQTKTTLHCQRMTPWACPITEAQVGCSTPSITGPHPIAGITGTRTLIVDRMVGTPKIITTCILKKQTIMMCAIPAIPMTLGTQIPGMNKGEITPTGGCQCPVRTTVVPTMGAGTIVLNKIVDQRTLVTGDIIIPMTETV